MPSSSSTQLADNETMQCATEIESVRERESEHCNLHCLLIVAAVNAVRTDIKLRNAPRGESKGLPSSLPICAFY